MWAMKIQNKILETDLYFVSFFEGDLQHLQDFLLKKYRPHGSINQLNEDGGLQDLLKDRLKNLLEDEPMDRLKDEPNDGLGDGLDDGQDDGVELFNNLL
jgi:hypothetical protein